MSVIQIFSSRYFDNTQYNNWKFGSFNELNSFVNDQNTTTVIATGPFIMGTVNFEITKIPVGFKQIDKIDKASGKMILGLPISFKNEVDESVVFSQA